MIKGLIVSCQVENMEPDTENALVCYYAAMAEEGGADALRICGVENVRAVRAQTKLPIIGLTKGERSTSKAYITPSMDDAVKLSMAGADFVAVDATQRNRWPYERNDWVSFTHLIGDVDSIESAEAAAKDGRFVMMTTALAGYTEETMLTDLPAQNLAIEIQVGLGVPTILEGGVWNLIDADCPVDAICIGSAITRPHLITKRFKEAICESALQQ